MKKKDESRNLSKIERASDERGLTMEQVLAHPVVQQMTRRLEEMREIVQGLPEAIGRAVAQATKRPPAGACGPPVPILNPKEVEFHKGGKVIEDGKVIEYVPRTGKRKD